ncbi:MAG: hypothetical protein M1816_003146 [Peltula sp. TS41687]|nr:MAG: hypothetical protein M1816_003146 [Peltula sp. TS41687]
MVPPRQPDPVSLLSLLLLSSSSSSSSSRLGEALCGGWTQVSGGPSPVTSSSLHWPISLSWIRLARPRDGLTPVPRPNSSDFNTRWPVSTLSGRKAITLTSPVHLTPGEYGVDGAGTFEYPGHVGLLNASMDSNSNLGSFEHGEGFRDLKTGGRHHRDGQAGDSVSVSPKSISNALTINHAARGSQGQASPWNRGHGVTVDGDGILLQDHPAPPSAADEEQKPPAWSLLKTKAGKQRRRLPLACFACRQKKVRCSGEQPTCKHCQRWRISCVYKTRTRKAAATRRGSKELQDMKPGETSNVDESPSELLSARSTVASSSRGTSTSTKWAAPGSRSMEDTFDDEPERQAEESPVYEIAREIPPVTPQHQRFDLKDPMPSKESDRALSTSMQGHLSGVPFDFVNNSSYPVLHQQDIGRRSSANVQPVLVLALCHLPAQSQGQAGSHSRQPSESLEVSRSTSFQAENFDAADGGSMLSHYYHPPMVLPQHVSLTSGLPATLQEREDQPPDLYPSEETHGTTVGSALGQIYHPPMILPQQMYHSDLYSHDAQGTAESGLASYQTEALDTSRTQLPFGTDIHPPMVLPQHLIDPSVYSQQQKGHVSQTPLSQLVYPNHIPLGSAHTPPNFLGHQDNEFQYASYQGMNIFSATSAAHSTSDGNRFVWPMNYADMGNESLDHTTIPTWSASLHDGKGGGRDIATSREGPTSGFLRSSSPGRDEAKYG